MSSDQPPLELRDENHLVTEVTLNGATRPVLGIAHPDEADKRARLLRNLGYPPSPRDAQAASPRAARLATIDEPLPQRSQTILSHEVDAALRQRLNGGGEAPAQPRNADVGGTHPRRRP
jgi:hypothetical protein